MQNMNSWQLTISYLVDQATEGGIVKVGGTLPDKMFVVNFGALIPNMVVIPKGVAAFSLYFSFKPRFDENRKNLLSH